MNYLRFVALGVCSAVVSLLALMSPASGGEAASAEETTTTLFQTVPGLVQGEGGMFDQPWWDAIVASSPPTYGADQVQFGNGPDMDQAREDLVTGQADFAVAEGPLTGPLCTSSGMTTTSLGQSCTLSDEVGVYSDEAGTAAANGLTVAYIPVAMEAVAVPFIDIPPTGCSQGNGAGTVADPYGCTLVPTINMSPSTLQTVFEGASPDWSIPAIEADNNGQRFTSQPGCKAHPANEIH